MSDKTIHERFAGSLPRNDAIDQQIADKFAAQEREREAWLVNEIRHAMQPEDYLRAVPEGFSLAYPVGGTRRTIGTVAAAPFLCGDEQQRVILAELEIVNGRLVCLGVIPTSMAGVIDRLVAFQRGDHSLESRPGCARKWRSTPARGRARKWGRCASTSARSCQTGARVSSEAPSKSTWTRTATCSRGTAPRAGSTSTQKGSATQSAAPCAWLGT
jgi:hypothetical protein